jgi:hypothetical protein
MRTFSLALALSVVVAGLSGASEELTTFIPGPGGNPADIDREVLWLDNPDFDGNVGSSEIVEALGVVTEIANDFLLETEVTLEKVTWWGAYWCYDGTPTGSGFNLRFYHDDGCLPEDAPFLEYLLPGDTCGEEYAEGGDMYAQYVYEYCLCEPLSPGLYWFSAQMRDHVYQPQWGRQGADMTQGCDSAFRSEYFSYPDWVSAPDVFGDEYDASQMFEDECEATATETSSWGNVKGLFW